MNIYTISGLGANHKAFQYLKIHEGFNLIPIPWLIPEKKESLQHYVLRMLEQVKADAPFLLMGLSFGGVIVQEMNHYIQPKHTFLVSTVKSRKELPTLIRFSARTGIHQVVPTQFFTNESVISYSFFRKLYDPKMPKLGEFFEYKNPKYLSWSINQMVNWNNRNPIENYTHIHGDKDVVFPSKRIKNFVRISGGTHLMVMQKPFKVSEVINAKLGQLQL